MVFFTDWEKRLREAERNVLSLIESPTVTISTFDTPIDTPSPTRRCCRVSKTSIPYCIHAVKLKSTAHSTTIGPPLVLIHGFVAASLNYFRNLEGLTQLFGTVYSVDLLGWGLSTRVPGLVFDSTSECEAWFCESLEAWRSRVFGSDIKIVLAGHSMGGYLTVPYAEMYAQSVERIILMVPAGVQERAPKRSMADVLWKTNLIGLGTFTGMLPTKAIKMVVNNALGDYMTPHERSFFTDYLTANIKLPTPPISQLFDTQSIACLPLSKRIPKLSINIALIYAERDKWMKVEYGQRIEMQSSLPILVIRDAGHACMWKHPRRFNVAVALSAGMSKDQIVQTIAGNCSEDDWPIEASPL